MTLETLFVGCVAGSLAGMLAQFFGVPGAVIGILVSPFIGYFGAKIFS